MYVYTCAYYIGGGSVLGKAIQSSGLLELLSAGIIQGKCMYIYIYIIIYTLTHTYIYLYIHVFT